MIVRTLAGVPCLCNIISIVQNMSLLTPMTLSLGLHNLSKLIHCEIVIRPKTNTQIQTVKMMPNRTTKKKKEKVYLQRNIKKIIVRPANLMRTKVDVEVAYNHHVRNLPGLHIN